MSSSVFNAKNFGVSVKYGHYEQFYPQQSLPENVHFQSYSSEDYFKDFTSTFLDLYVVVKKSNNKKPTSAEVSYYENCLLHNLFRQITVFYKWNIGDPSNNLSYYESYQQFLLMSPVSYKKLRGMAIGYE